MLPDLGRTSLANAADPAMGNRREPKKRLTGDLLELAPYQKTLAGISDMDLFSPPSDAAE